MYKVIIADDHMPVLEYISTSIPWKDLDLELVAACSDGEEAMEECLREKPDILITDIGMPKKNGLELVETAQKLNPDLEIIILSCHEEFHYAQQAVRLNVNEYILKESLHIPRLKDLLHGMVRRLREKEADWKDRRNLQDVVRRNRSAIHTTFLRSFMEQPILNELEWIDRAETLGLRLRQGIPYLPVLCVLERYATLEERFGGANALQFVIENALNESVVTEDKLVLIYDEKHYFILFPFPKTIKRNLHDEIRLELQQIQESVHQKLRIGISFIIGKNCSELSELKKHIHALLGFREYRFYAGEHRILALKKIETTNDDIFVHYAEVLQETRNHIVSGTTEQVVQSVNKWIGLISSNRYPINAVRGWVLKIVSDIELKHSVMQHFTTNYSVEKLQQTIYAIDTLEHLREWFSDYVLRKMEAFHVLRGGSARKEIAEAKRYVMTHLEEKVGMEEMAIRMGMNSTHFSRTFKKETGEAFVSFVTRCKMERAKEMLDQCNLNVDAIAERLGFEHTSYFIKLFRGFSGLSPAEYRKRV
jgi:two-component system response regulator YesN